MHVICNSCIYTITLCFKYELVQSGELLSIDLLASDEVNNSREAVWSLESPDHSIVR